MPRTPSDPPPADKPIQPLEQRPRLERLGARLGFMNKLAIAALVLALLVGLFWHT